MREFRILIIRIILSLIFSYLLCWLFLKDTQLYKVLGLAAIMFGLAYFFQRVRKGKED